MDCAPPGRQGPGSDEEAPRRERQVEAAPQQTRPARVPRSRRRSRVRGPTRARRRRRRGRGHGLAANAAAPRRSMRHVGSGRSSRRPGAGTFLRVAPRDSPFAIVEPPPIGEVDERGVGPVPSSRFAGTRASPIALAPAGEQAEPMLEGIMSAKNRRSSDSSRSSMRVSTREPAADRRCPAGVIGRRAWTAPRGRRRLRSSRPAPSA